MSTSCQFISVAPLLLRYADTADLQHDRVAWRHKTAHLPNVPVGKCTECGGMAQPSKGVRIRSACVMPRGDVRCTGRLMRLASLYLRGECWRRQW